MNRTRTSPTQLRLLRRLRQQAAGQIVRYEDFADLGFSVSALASALSRLTQSGQVQRVAKGQYRVAPTGRFGPVPPSEQQLVQASLRRTTRDNQTYPTGNAVFNQLGLTTQVAAEIEIATPRRKESRRIGHVRIRFVPSQGEVKPDEVEVRQLLDALRRLKRVPASEPTIVLHQLRRRIAELSAADKQKLVRVAKHYNPATRALTGALLEGLQEPKLAAHLAKTLNPLTRYRLGLSAQALPNRDAWRIQ
jgi:hypothetical protein